MWHHDLLLLLGGERGTVWVDIRWSVCLVVVVFVNFSPISETTMLVWVQCITCTDLILVAYDKFQNMTIFSISLCVLFGFKWKRITQASPSDTIWRKKTAGQFAGTPSMLAVGTVSCLNLSLVLFLFNLSYGKREARLSCKMGSFWNPHNSAVIVLLVLVIFYLYLSRVSNKNQRLDRFNLLSTYHIQGVVQTTQMYKACSFPSRNL